MVNISTLNLICVKEKGVRYDLDKKSVSCPSDSVKIFNLVFNMEDLAEEVFVLMTLDTKNKITGTFTVSIGALSSSIVHPREVYKRALLQNSASIIVAHNHPSGDPTPSNEDIIITKRLKEAGDILGIKLLDHVIIGNKKHASMKEKGII